MNRVCTECGKPTIGKKWMVYKTLLPFVFLFLQIKCGRCKKEQAYDLVVPWYWALLWEMIFPVIISIAAIYVAVWVNFNIWLIVLVALMTFVAARSVKLMMLLKMYP